MTDPRPAAPLPRPARRPRPDRSTTRFYDLVETRFVRLVRDNPVLATVARPPRTTTTCSATAAARRCSASSPTSATHLAAIEALDPAGLSPRPRFERELELHNVRRAIFDADELRIWERRSFALDHVGDGLFLLFARDHAPLAERLDAIAGRLEAAATYLEEAKTRATVPQVRRWQRVEIETAARAARLLRRDRRRRRGRPAGRPSSAGSTRAASRPRSASSSTTAWLEGTLADGTDDWAIGRERHDALVAPARLRRPRRRRDPRARLGAAGARSEAARAAAAREIDPDADESRSSTGSRPTSRRLRRRPSRPTATRCSAPARTSSSTTS